MPLPRSVLRMTPDELDEFLVSQRTARVATVSPDGEPHVVPLWFVWHDGALWVTSLRKSRRMSDLRAGSRVAVCLDDGYEYAELRGAVMYGRFTEMEPPQAVRKLLGDKYWGGIDVPDIRSHTWLCLKPDRIASWDFRKIPANRDPRLRPSADGQ